MSGRGVRKFVADLLGGRPTRSLRVEDSEVAELRAAITLRAARPGAQTPREEFVTGLYRRLAAARGAEQPLETDPSGTASRDVGAAVDRTRRGLVAAASIAAAAAAVGAGVDHVITARGRTDTGGETAAGSTDQTLTPVSGQWRTVAASTDLAEGTVRGFDLGAVIGFVARTDGQLGAVSGVCTHLGCRLNLDAAAGALNCPCHNTSFEVSGELLHYQLAVAPRALPRLPVREVDGAVQVYAPGGPV